MRFILLFLISILVSASEFPQIFSSAGDEIYENMKKYYQIKDLPTYKNRPELLEAYCLDANATMLKGFALDKIIDDPELSIDKAIIKSYAKELRILDRQNEKILSELDNDVGKMYEEGDFKSLKKISLAGFVLSDKMLAAIKESEKKELAKKELAKKVAKLKKSVEKPVKVVKTPVKPAVAIGLRPTPLAASIVNKELAKEVIKVKKSIEKPAVIAIVPVKEPVAVVAPKPKPVAASMVKKELVKEAVEVKKSTVKPTVVAVIPVAPPITVVPTPIPVSVIVRSEPKEEMPPVPKVKKKQTKLEYYEDSLMNLKEELYALRESEDQKNMSCLNDITAINYWMINVLKSENEACDRADAIKQMKSYDKASSGSCGRGSMRYIEWHGRIKPYVGRKLFEAEAGCNQ